MLTRRRFLKFSAMAGAGALLPLKWRTRSCAAIPDGTLDPTTILKYTEPLIIPPAMPMTRTSVDLDYYEIAVRQFEQQILPTGYPATTVWSYGSISHPGALNYPAFHDRGRAGGGGGHHERDDADERDSEPAGRSAAPRTCNGVESATPQVGPRRRARIDS